ncbi:TPA: hypothetical protein TVN83_001940, partial [Streptococcus equi subsp. zooepidemicus]|nr:hypothetical protein [Streptococcus equi subsp. zooepidemicus]
HDDSRYPNRYCHKAKCQIHPTLTGSVRCGYCLKASLISLLRCLETLGIGFKVTSYSLISGRRLIIKNML